MNGWPVAHDVGYATERHAALLKEADRSRTVAGLPKRRTESILRQLAALVAPTWVSTQECSEAAI